MLWEIKKLENREDFDELEKFYKEKFENLFHYRLTSEYLYWKLNKNTHFNGVMLVAKYSDKIIGSLSLTIKEGFLGSQNKLIAEIGDSYVDFNAQKKITLILKKNKDQRNYSRRSIFGNLANYLLEMAEKKNIALIYGVPNNKSYQGYTKNLNFKKINILNTYSFTLPCFKEKKNIFNYSIFLNSIFKIYRKLLCKIFFSQFSLTMDENITSEEINNLSEEKENRFYLNRSYEYFDSKYKLNPENNFKFCKIFKKSKLIGLFVLKEDSKNKKIYLVDCLVKEEQKLLTKFVAIKSTIDKNYSVIFWEENTNVKLLEKIIFPMFKRKKINIIYYDKKSFDQNLFFNKFHLGFSDNF